MTPPAANRLFKSWLSALSSSYMLLSAQSVSAQNVPDVPQFNLGLELGIVAHVLADIEHINGPSIPFAWRKAYPNYRLRGAYRLDARNSLSISAGKSQIPHTFKAHIADARDTTGTLLLDGRTYSGQGGGTERWEFDILYGYRALGGHRWDMTLSAGARLTRLSRTGYSVHFSRTFQERVEYLRLVGSLNAGVHWSGVIGVDVQYSFRNYNRIGLRLEYCYAPFVVWSGTYVVASGTDQESHGTFAQRGSYGGAVVSYTFAWGAPKEPRWMRRQQKKAAKNGG